ncbi:CPBP family intramembrane glutamic endopeptidase [Salinirubrum litoreum]|uniref:CPBP family intramembrane glutamic endopeptidase n=1 Tax=Salinirubrum litoreum TaxID=1126234 RepID=A0ABD5RGW6_9EURY|nr:CPBP family intramembrane glutamic endopeptidase [Salinirubrum litoreum]
MSSLGDDLRHGAGIARVELRRSLRKSFGTRKRQLAVLAFVALFAPLLVFWGDVAYSAGQAAAGRGISLEILGIQLTLLVVVFVVMGALRVVQQGRPDGDSLLLTTTTTRAILLGTTAHATVQLVGFVLVPTVLFAGGFALGAGQPLLLLTAVLAVLPLFTCVSLLGTVLGQAVVLGLLRSRSLRAVSRGFGVVLLVALMGLSYAAMAPVMGATEPLAPFAVVATPATLYLAFVFVGTPFAPSPGVGSGLVGLTVLVSIPVFFAVATRLAPRLWFADATPSGLFQRDATSKRADVSTPTGDVSGRVGATFPPRVGPRPLSLALGLWVRWLRIPVRFTSLFPLVIVAAVALFGTITDPETLPLVVGGLLVFVGAYVSGGVFGLNPLGEAGEMRVVETLSATGPATLVASHVVAGLLVGTPLAVVGSILLALSLGLPALPAAAGVALAVVLTVASASVAVAIGSVVPSTDAERTYRGYAVATPSQWALIGYILAVVVLLGVTTVGAVLVMLATDPGTTGPSFVVGAAVAAGTLLAVGYAGVRVATRRFGAGPYRDSDDADDSLSPRTDDDATERIALRTTALTPRQQRRGLVLLGTFVVLRAALARVWDRYFPGGYSSDPLFLAFLGGLFLLLSVGLVYLGFTRWVGVDLRAWWVDRGRLRGDLGWGVLGVVAVLVATVGGTLALTLAFPDLASAGGTGAAPAPTVAAEAASGLAVNLLLGWFFGFAIAAFQEETLFRGFLQGLLQERYGRLVAIVGQAAVFALAHLGYYPVSAWPLVAVVFLVGIVLGWLVDRRGTLLAAGIAHGVVG